MTRHPRAVVLFAALALLPEFARASDGFQNDTPSDTTVKWSSLPGLKK